ncbi:MAG: lysozyme inhibitor LprI family protein [Yersiniaceae bacterium]|nr:lysozyme inhibitor LprI family protein [Yersiniaceae bacterium]
MKFLLVLLFASFPSFSFERCISQNINDLVACSAKNYKDEDLKLNYLYKQLINTYPELKENIKLTQKLWVKARDSICAYNQKDGEEYKVYQNSCLLEQTYERNRELKAIMLKQSALSNKNIGNLNPLWKEYMQSHCKFMQDKYSDNDCVTRNNFLHSPE